MAAKRKSAAKVVEQPKSVDEMFVFCGDVEDGRNHPAPKVDNSGRVAELKRQIGDARLAYYNGDPAVSDDVYDAWVDELAGIEPDAAEVTAIGAPPPEKSPWKKVRHSVPMGSLDKLNTLDEMQGWILQNAKDQWLLITEKLDGLSIRVEYEDGKFVQAVTRGGGDEGEDITANVAKMQGVPAELADKAFTGSLRGEIMMTLDTHKQHFPDKANPRNAAAGVSRRLDGKGCELLRVMFYGVQDGNTSFGTEEEQFQFLQGLGLMTPWWAVTIMAPGVKTPQDHYVEYEQTKRVALPYEIDGLVVRINDLAKQQALGSHNNKPKGAIAWKFAAISRETTIRKIVRQTGGTGRITPVAVFDPVSILGAQITQASLYNWTYIKTIGVDVGARALVSRANDVIPRVTVVIKGTGTVNQPPATCDVCGAATVRDGEYVVCPNASACPAQVVGRVQAWLSTVNVLEWGDALVERLVAAGLVKSPADLYRLTAAQLAGLERMGEKSAENVLRTLSERNPIALDQFVGGLSIPMIGASMIRMAMDAGYDTLEALQSASYGQLKDIKGFGPEKATSLYEGLKAAKPLIDDLLSAGAKIKAKVIGNLNGQSFCFTGSMKNKRPVLEQMVADNGGNVKSGVGKGLTYLVIADPNSTSSKAEAARKNGTKCISEDDFLAMIGA